MLTKRVTRVTLSRITEAAGAGITSFVSTELWRVEWDEVRSGKTDTMAHNHYTEVAARRHVEGLLGQVDSTVGKVYTEYV